MSYPYNEYNSGDNELRGNDGYDAREADARGIRTEAGRNALNHFNNAAQDIGRATAEFNSGGGREAVESVGNPIANRNEGEGEKTNPFLRPAQLLAEATQEGLKGLPGAILEFATGQYEAHKVHPEGHRRDQEQFESNRD
ncbi:hypothetical protein OPQ81_000929 [Rhizoctonia solani]|nr:hypothetical protein OPQ81_000929 [Rhizoctonia solani]